jgi:hypothetical protein
MVTLAITGRMHTVSTARTEAPLVLVVRDVMHHCAPDDGVKECPKDTSTASGLPPRVDPDCGPVLH